MFRAVVQSLRQKIKLFMGFSSVNYGYTMLNPLLGIYFMVNMNVYIKGNSHHNAFDTNVLAVRNFSSLVFKEEGTSYGDTETESTQKQPKINFIVPLSGKIMALRRFLRQYEMLLTRNENQITLTFVLLCVENPCNESVLVIQSTKERFPSEEIRYIELQMEFNRAIALDKGISLFPKDTLLFFADVDLHITDDILLRIRRNTIQHKQIYFPIMFSEFHPNMRGRPSENYGAVYRFNNYQGYWRIFSLGPVAIYKSDYDFIGGFDLSIGGWGKEDRDLWERAIKKNITTFRSADVGIRHIYHDSYCDPTTPKDQYYMCLSSKSLNYASTAAMAHQFYGRGIW